MISYSKNKGFIPEAFIEKVERKNINTEKRILILFLCINLICVPFSIEAVNKNNLKNVEQINQYSYSEKEGFDFEHIYELSKSLLDEEIKECDITNDGGRIVVENIDKAVDVTKNNEMRIYEFIQRDNGSYEVIADAYKASVD